MARLPGSRQVDEAVSVNQLRDQAVPGVLASPWPTAEPTPRTVVRRSRWTPWGRVFAVGAAVALAGAVLGILRIVDPHFGGVAVSFGAGLAFLSIGAQFLLDQFRRSRSRVRWAIGLVFQAHILLVPALGIALIVYAVGSLIGYRGFH